MKTELEKLSCMLHDAFIPCRYYPYENWRNSGSIKYPRFGAGVVYDIRGTTPEGALLLIEIKENVCLTYVNAREAFEKIAKHYRSKGRRKCVTIK